MLSEFFQLISKLFCFTSYFAKESYPKPLDSTQEALYLEKYAKGDLTARDMLIKHNLRLVAHISKKYCNNFDIDDLISVGSIGLVKGISTYSNNKGTVLATYLARCIENEMLMMIRSGKRYKNTMYLNEPIGVDSDGNEYSLMEVLSIKEETIFKQVENSILSLKLKEILSENLDERELEIISLRYGLDKNPPQTQLEVAKKLEISRSYISRIETKALKKIREKLNKNDY